MKRCSNIRRCIKSYGGRIVNQWIGVFQYRKEAEPMLKFIGRILRFSGRDAGKIKASFVISFFESIMNNGPILAALYILMHILDGTVEKNSAWRSFAIVLVSLVLRWILRRILNQMVSGSGTSVSARERIAVGDLFKRFPMSYFTEGNLGYVTSVITVDLAFVEDHGMMRLDGVINGLASMLIGCATLWYFDWRLSVVSIAICALSFVCFNMLERISKTQSKIRQEQQSRLTSAVLEYTQGISVIKALHMAGEKAQSMEKTIDETCEKAITFEELFKPANTHYLNCFALAIASVVFLASWFCFNGELGLPVMIMIFIFIFQIYRPVMALADTSAIMRVMEASTDRYEALKKNPIIDADGREIKPKHFDIAFENVSFSYGEKETLKNISFTVPEKSMTALVGASGSGKTTIANLLLRFWDVQEGAIKIGGHDLREMTCDSLLENVSMVFQNVYLFQDTIEANIRFGRVSASREEIIAAAKKARCHDFITALPNGYDTLVGEGGSTLSGGEKQRISIARAILKDAPIIVLDEATASVDPDNEQYIQEAINDLVRDKTLIIIAHRLSTVVSASQILVLDNGRVAQKGRHEELLARDGAYKNLWERRQRAKSWKIEKQGV
jgi:ATP-binding cassette subfamily B protein